MELFDLTELKRALASGDVVTRDLATTAALGVLLDDLIERRQRADAETSAALLLAECRTDVARNGADGETVTLTHLPTGVRVVGRERAEALANLRTILAGEAQLAAPGPAKAFTSTGHLLHQAGILPPPSDRINVSSAADGGRVVYRPAMTSVLPLEVRAKVLDECTSYVTTGHVTLTHPPTDTMSADVTREAAADLLMTRIPVSYLARLAGFGPAPATVEMSSGGVVAPDPDATRITWPNS